MTSRTDISICGNCGGNLDVQEGQRIVTCSYCGAKVKVKRTEAMRAPGPPPPRHAGPPRAARRRAWVVPVVLAAVVGTVVAGSSIAVFLSARQTNEAAVGTPISPWAPPAAAEPPKPPPLPESRRPFLLDVNRDGIEDIVSTHSTNWDENIHVVAFSGADFGELWRSENLGAPAQLGGRPELWVVGTVIMATVAASMTAFDAGSGRRLWNASFSDKVERMSLAGAAVRVESSDGKRHLVDLSTGHVSADGDKKPIRFHLRNDWTYTRLANHSYMDLRGGHQWKGLYMDQAYCPEEKLSAISPEGRKLGWTAHYKGYCYTDPGVAYAYRDTGSAIPFLVGYDRRKRTIIWQVQLSDPGSIVEVNEDPKVAFFGDRILVVYNLRKEGAFFARLMRVADGATIWKTELGKPEHGSISIEAALLTAQRAYVRTGYRFVVLDAATGAHLATMRD
jgi:DNA-directed RNA polymerase subunit RPC12/RpoP